MVEDKILTRHPEGKKGRSINKQKYDVVKASILKCLRNKELTFTDLAMCVRKMLKGKFEGFLPWYVETVKLDLEARNIIEGTSKKKPQLYRLKESSK